MSIRGEGGRKGGREEGRKGGREGRGTEGQQRQACVGGRELRTEKADISGYALRSGGDEGGVHSLVHVGP